MYPGDDDDVRLLRQRELLPVDALPLHGGLNTVIILKQCQMYSANLVA